jgi:hypothetical protein
MKHRTTLLTAWLFAAVLVQGQEFTVHPNGLIYSGTAMTQLHHIVDSLDLRFRSCPVDKVYRSLPHARAKHVSVKGADARALARDIERGLSLEEIERKHRAVAKSDAVVCAFTDYQDGDEWHTTAVPISFSSRMQGILHAPGRPFQEPGPYRGKWLVERSEYDGKDYLEAVVLVEEPVWTALPERYGRLIQYVDCLIDTTQRVYTGEGLWGRRIRTEDPNGSRKLRRLMAEHVTAEPPEWNEADTAGAYEAAYEAYTLLREQQLDSLAARPEFRPTLDEAIRKVLAEKDGDPELEELALRYGSKADALAMMRNRRVVGGCSMDASPRYHALAIATLAAETVNWDIFLRSHLDILNDYFMRSSDGSYAWAQRQTYVRELEELGIPVADLLLGTLLAADNTSEGHYRSAANRTGRAMTEARDASAIAERMLAMVADPELDLYNRAVIYYAYLNYNGHLEDEAVRERNEAALDEALRSVPGELIGKRN